MFTIITIYFIIDSKISQRTKGLININSIITCLYNITTVLVRSKIVIK